MSKTFKQFVAEADEVESSDYKMTASGKKVRARHIVFNDKEKVEEAYGRREDAYTRDYKSSVSGFGRRSAAYHADGGANDEGWDNEPSHKTADHPHAVHINGKKWKTFGSQSHATNVAKKIKGATVHREEFSLEEAVDPSEVAGNPRMYSAEVAKKAYYHKRASASDKESLARHLDRYHGNKEWRKPVKEEAESIDEAMTTQQKNDFDRMMAGAMSRAAYNAKWKKPLKSDSKVIYGKNVKEETISEGAYEKSEENKKSADSAKAQGDMFAHHMHMADHHDNLAQWHDEKGRHNLADIHASKAASHHEKAMQVKEEVVVEDADNYFANKIAQKKAAQKAETAEYRKHGVTARKHGGNDSHSWAVFVNGRTHVTGLSSREVPYYKKEALKKAKETRGVAEGLEESMTDSWKRVQSMDKGSITGGKEEVAKRLTYLRAVHAHHKKFGNDTLKVRKEIESINRSRIAEELDEKLTPSMGAGEYIKDFQKSDAPQFQGKSKEKRRMMALAAYMAAKKSVDEEVDLNEATVETKKYSWGTMKTVHHGASFSIPLHPEHHQAIAKLHDNQEHKFKSEDGRHWTAKRMGDDVHFHSANNGPKTTVKHSTMHEEVERVEEGYIVKYHAADGEHKNSSKVFADKAKAQAHADKGNSINKVGGKYTVHKIDAEGRTVKEELDFNEEGDLMAGKISYSQFMEALWPGTPEYERAFPKRTTGRGARHDIVDTGKGVRAIARHNDDEQGETETHEKTEKRGRGRPAGSKSGARTNK
jgi:hypothetical protein